MKEFLLDLIFPKRCIGCKKFGEYLCANCFATVKFSQKHTCPICNKSSLNGFTHLRCKKQHDIDGIVAGVEYRGVIKKLISQLSNPPYLKDLIHPASDLLYEALIQNEFAMKLVTDNLIITSVPLTKKTQQKRGYNQADLIAKQLSTNLNLTYKKTLKKTKDDASSIGNFLAINNTPLTHKTIFLVDDLTSTGKTLRECATVLKYSGAERVVGIAFARA